MASISLQGITKRFGDVTAVDDLQVDIADGEFFVLLGPSGAGEQNARVAPQVAGTVSPTANVTASLGKQPGLNRNGVRSYLKVRMPTFNFSPNELQALVNFFMGDSAQQMPYTPERLDPLTPEEQGMARAIFTSPAAPCLKCHMTGDAAHDARATAQDSFRSVPPDSTVSALHQRSARR